jgi:hypothetical protein
MMEISKAVQLLEIHNKWRRGDDGVKMVNPTELGEAIDTVVNNLKNHGVIGDVTHSFDCYLCGGAIPYDSISDSFKKSIDSIEDNLNR